MSKPLPYFIGRISFDLSLKIFFCGHEADATYQKANFVFFLSKEYSPRSNVACQHAFEQTAELFLCFSFKSGACSMEPIFIQKAMGGVSALLYLYPGGYRVSVLKSPLVLFTPAEQYL